MSGNEEAFDFDDEAGATADSSLGEGSDVSEAPQASLEAPSVSTYEEARKIIMERHGMVIDKEDPLLVMVTLLDENRSRTHKDNEEVVEKLRLIVEQAKGELLGAARETSSVILDQAVNSNLKTTLAKLASETQLIESLRHEIKKHKIWVGVLTSITVITTVMLFVTQV
jgi:hypothetical protein